MNPEQFYPYLLRCSKVTIDSRKISQDDIFFAFSGENFNAALLASEAVDNGALAVIVEQKEFEDIQRHIYAVPSTLEFMQELAKLHRQRLGIPVIALTGSNGKTTTKEIIHAVLSQKYRVQYTQGNLNNHIGVPLTLLSLKSDHEIAVVEMGANHLKEIEHLCTIATPDYGYITNFGKAHLEGFGGFEGVITGKSELYDYLKKNGKTVFVNQDDALQVVKTAGYQRKISFGTEKADYQFVSFSKDKYVGLIYNGVAAQSRLTGNYNFSNLCAAASIGLHFGVGFDKIKMAIEGYSPTNMRSQIMEKNGRTLVLDTYNANPSSMTESLKNFNTFQGSKAIVIGDMLELGDESGKEHTEILTLASGMDFDEVITVGRHFRDTGVSPQSFDSADELVSYLKENRIKSRNILLKGSRGIALEQILEFI